MVTDAKLLKLPLFCPVKDYIDAFLFNFNFINPFLTNCSVTYQVYMYKPAG